MADTLVSELPPADHRSRRDRLRGRLDDLGLAALYVTRLADVRWLTGFTGSAAALLITGRADTDLFITDGRYADQAAEEVSDLDRDIRRGGVAARVLERAADSGATPVGFQADVLPWSEGQRLRDLADDHGLAVEPAESVLDHLRAVKDDHELAALGVACALTGDAFEAVLGDLHPGRSERDIGLLLERAMIERGAEDRAFDTIVASGPNSAVPHHRAGDRAIQRGDLVKIDLGARFAGYHADMTRTVAVGPPDAELAAVHDLVRQAQEAGREAAVAGAEVGQVDAACRDLIAAAGRGERFTHGTGHGVGLEIHEWPVLLAAGAATLAARMTVTVEPGVYLPGIGGVRIEDTVVIAPEGPPQVLTTPTRELLVL